MPERIQGLPLDIIRSEARRYLAVNGDANSELYLSEAIYYEGEVLLPGRGDIVVPRNSVLVFADDEPDRNWGHACRYLFHDPQTGYLTGEIRALLPPTPDFGESFTAFHASSASSVSSTLFSRRWPLLRLPCCPNIRSHR